MASNLIKTAYDAIKPAFAVDQCSAAEAERRVVELNRCISDPVYFASNYQYIRSIDLGTILLPPYEKQADLIRSVHDHRFTICLASRQSGKTTGYIAICLHTVFFSEGKEIVILANKEKTAIGILKRIKQAYEWIPKEKSWIKPGIVRWSEKQIEFDNGCTITAMASSSDAARSASAFLCITGDNTVKVKINGVYKKLMKVEDLAAIIKDEREQFPCHLTNGLQPAIDFCKTAKNCLGSKTNVGFNERKLVEEFSKKTGFKFETGKHIYRYFPDGLYKNIVLEINEKHHCSKSRISHDVKKYDFLISKGYKIIIIWERLSKSKFWLVNFYKDRYGDKIIQYAIPDFRIFTDEGWSTFDDIICTGERSDIVELNSSLRCTSDHKIFTNRGKVEAKDCEGLVTKAENGSDVKISVKELHGVKEKVYDVINVRNSKHSFFVNGKFLISNCIVDECAFIPHNIATALWESIFPTISRSKTSKIVLVSTPNGIGGLFHNIWCDATIGCNPAWNAVQIDWWDVPGRDEQWKEEQIRGFGPGGELKFAQEYGNQFLGSSPTLLDSTALRELIEDARAAREAQPQPVEVWTIKTKIDNYEIKVWKKPQPYHAYILGGDVSEGVGLDSSVAKIFDVTDPRKIEEVASFDSNTIPGPIFGYVMSKMARRYNEAYIACERNGVSSSAIDALWRVYEYENIVDIGSNKYAVGIFSNWSVKLDACLWLKDQMKEPDFSLILRDPAGVLEFQKFERVAAKTTVRYEASSGHDDQVMATIWAIYITKPDLIENYFEISSRAKSVYGGEIITRIHPVLGSGIYAETEEQLDQIWKSQEKKADLEFQSQNKCLPNAEEKNEEAEQNPEEFYDFVVNDSKSNADDDW